MDQEPGRAVIEFDHHSSEFAADAPRRLREFRQQCPVAWSDHHAGFWSVFAHAEALQAFRDHDAFVNRKFVDERTGELRGGILIPAMPSLELVPDELDPPEWRAYRKILNPFFAPSAVEAMRPRMMEVTDGIIDGFIENGSADLVLDLANPAPALVSIEVMGFDPDDLMMYAVPFHETAYAQAGSPEREHADEGFQIIVEHMMNHVAQRRRAPNGDFTSQLLEARIDDEPIDDRTVVSMLMNVLGGGIDTTTALLSSVFVELHEHPENRARLAEDELLMRTATEEYLRYFSPIQGIGRSTSHDVELGGQYLRPRESVLLSIASMNRDPAVFDRPDELILDRMPNRHSAFGLGIHRCLGSSFARAVFQVILTQVLQRMPDYRIHMAKAKPYPSLATVNGWIGLPAMFTPGARLSE
jgi:cytochrome P450